MHGNDIIDLSLGCDAAAAAGGPWAARRCSWCVSVSSGSRVSQHAVSRDGRRPPPQRAGTPRRPRRGGGAVRAHAVARPRDGHSLRRARAAGQRRHAGAALPPPRARLCHPRRFRGPPAAAGHARGRPPHSGRVQRAVPAAGEPISSPAHIFVRHRCGLCSPRTRSQVHDKGYIHRGVNGDSTSAIRGLYHPAFNAPCFAEFMSSPAMLDFVRWWTGLEKEHLVFASAPLIFCSGNSPAALDSLRENWAPGGGGWHRDGRWWGGDDRQMM